MPVSYTIENNAAYQSVKIGSLNIERIYDQQEKRVMNMK